MIIPMIWKLNGFSSASLAIERYNTAVGTGLNLAEPNLECRTAVCGDAGGECPDHTKTARQEEIREC